MDLVVAKQRFPFTQAAAMGDQSIFKSSSPVDVRRAPANKAAC
jgi:hypothetical protein